jgi:DNA-binding winged helix-turn-helix (wHTH) protein
MGISLQFRVMAACFTLSMVLAVHPAYGRDEPAALPADKINLALRRTADKLLRAAGDSTSRIPAVRQIDASTWQVEVGHVFAYEQLPAILQASLDQYGIKQSYAVSIRTCDDATIDLGFHQRDILQDSVVPCMGREAPEGCHFIEVKFDAGMTADSSRAALWWLLVPGLLVGAGLLWRLRRKPQPVHDTGPDMPSDIIPVGHSTLHPAAQVLESGGHKHPLTYREAKLLRLFATHPDTVLERDAILQQVWGDEGVQVGRSIDMFVSRLRKKLRDDPTVNLVAVHGVGYKLETKS